MRHNRIRRDKPPYKRIIKSCVVIIESILTIEFLVCKELDKTFRPPKSTFFTPLKTCCISKSCHEIKDIKTINQVYIAVKEKSLFSLIARFLPLSFYIGSPWGRMGFLSNRQEDRTSKNIPEAT